MSTSPVGFDEGRIARFSSTGVRHGATQTQNVFGEWVDPEAVAYAQAPVRVIVVTDEMRRRDAQDRAARDRAASPAWAIRATLSEEALRPEPKAARRGEVGRIGAKVMRPCLWCGVAFSATELRSHRSSCAARPANTGGRQAEPKPCEWCGEPLAYRALRKHRPRCDKRPAQAGRGGGRPRAPQPCMWCGVEFSRLDMRAHRPECEKRPVLARGAAKPAVKAAPVKAVPGKTAAATVARGEGARRVRRVKCLKPECVRMLSVGKRQRADGLCGICGVRADRTARVRARGNLTGKPGDSR